MALAQAGCKVVVNGRDEARAEATAAEIRAATGARGRVVAGDVGDPAVREALLAACPAPDILVNNNGGPPPTPFEAITREKLLAGLEANMLTPIALVQAVAPGMAARKFGRIVNITSASVRAPIAGLDVSSGRARGPDRVSRQRGAQIRPRQRDDQFDPARRVRHRPRALDRSAAIPRRLAQRKAGIPAGRFGEPDEFGALCAFLCSAHAGYISGQNLLIDGGAFPGAF